MSAYSCVCANKTVGLELMQLVSDCGGPLTKAPGTSWSCEPSKLVDENDCNLRAESFACDQFTFSYCIVI